MMGSISEGRRQRKELVTWKTEQKQSPNLNKQQQSEQKRANRFFFLMKRALEIDDILTGM